MREWLLLVIVVLIGLIFYQNMTISHKLATIYKAVEETQFYLRDGVCE